MRQPRIAILARKAETLKDKVRIDADSKEYIHFMIEREGKEPVQVMINKEGYKVPRCTCEHHGIKGGVQPFTWCSYIIAVIKSIPDSTKVKK